MSFGRGGSTGHDWPIGRLAGPRSELARLRHRCATSYARASRRGFGLSASDRDGEGRESVGSDHVRYEQDCGLSSLRGLDSTEVRDPLMVPAEVREQPADDLLGLRVLAGEEEGRADRLGAN